MIASLKSLKKESNNLIEIISSCKNEDFYLTENNQRLYVNNLNVLKNLLKNSHSVFYEDRSENKGIVLVWKSYGGEKSRNYVKIIASNPETARGLLTVLLWNYDKDLYVKLKKDSSFISVFKEKGFKFAGGRGSELLLAKEKFQKPSLF